MMGSYTSLTLVRYGLIFKGLKRAVRLIFREAPRLAGWIANPRSNCKKPPEAARLPGILLQERMVPEMAGEGLLQRELFEFGGFVGLFPGEVLVVLAEVPVVGGLAIDRA